VGLAEVRLPGIIAAETVTVSAAVGDGGAVFTRAPGARRQCVPTPDSWACSPVWGQLGEEGVGLDRTFTARESTRLRAEVLVTPQQGAELNGLLDTLSGYRVDGSSQLLDDAVARPGAALDGDPATAWIPGVADLTPRLNVTYDAPLTVSTISVSDGLGSDPAFQTVVVAAAGRTFEARLDGGTATFPAVTSASWRIQLRRTTSGTGRIAVPRVNVTLGPDVDRTTGDVAVPCSAGLATIIDGRVERLSVKSNSRDVLLGGTIVADHCTSPVVPIAPGTHRVTSSAGGGFEVESVRLLPVTSTVGAAPALPVSVRTWLPEERSVSIPAGGASVVALTEGFNPGWVATVDGVTLEPVRLDGWRQAWRVPSGVGDRAVDMTYTPGRVQRLALAFGLLLLVGVVTAAAVRGSSAAPPSAPGRGRRATATLSAVLVPALVASWVGLLVGALVAGAAARVPPRIRALAGAGSVMLAGVVAAVVGGAWGSGGAAALVQTLTVIAVAVVAVSGVDDLESGGSSVDMHERRAFDDEP
jgi:arabinofuranan 3-O-arabinosyltransferase